MKISVIICLSLFTFNLACAADDNPDTLAWKDLSDDSSRSDLFRKVVEAKLEEEGKPTDEKSVSFALSKEFIFPRDTTYDDILKQPRSDSIFGVDISHWTGNKFDFSKLPLLKARFVYAKATQGVGFKDGLFTDYWKAMKNLSEQLVFRGAYHFLSSSGTGEAQARSFLRLISESGSSGANDMPPVLDLEWDIQKGTSKDRWTGRNPDEIIEIALKWLQYVEQHSTSKKKPILYTARSWWRERIGDDKKFQRFSGYKLWIADYSHSARAKEVPSVPGQAGWTLWQFSENGKLSLGYNGSIDANIYKGSDDQFYKDFELK